jgi:ankyrin repeat protein
MLASGTGNAGIVGSLLNRNADRFVQNSDGDTALSRAAFKNYPDVVSMLIFGPGAKAAGMTNNDGFTPLDLALGKGHDDIVALLQPVTPKTEL